MIHLRYLLLIWLSVILLYFPIFNIYFSQDDFFMFRTSLTDGSLLSFINLFSFPSFEERGYAFYRPLFREGLHNLYYSVFGLNHIPMRILIMIIHLVNVTLTYFLMLKILRNQKIALFVAFFFGISAGHVGTLYYLAGGMEVVGVTLFMLATLLLFYNFLEDKRMIFMVGAFLVFLLALASHELSVIIPLLLTGLVFVKSYRIIVLLPFFAVCAAYLYLDIVKIGFLQQEAQYKLVFDPAKIINSLSWYTVWAWGLPEMLIDYVGSNLQLQPNLMKFWGGYFLIIFPTFFISTGIFLCGVFYLFIKERKFFKNKNLWLLALWFPLALSPIILLPLHKSTHYLSPALVAYWGVVAYIGLNAYWEYAKENKFISRTMFGVWIIGLIILSISTVRLADKTYPSANRGRIAQKLISDIKAQYSQLPKGAIVYVKNDPNYPKITGSWGGSSTQAAFVLNNSDALQLVYNDLTMRVYYEDKNGMPADMPEKNIYPFIANITF